MLQVVDASVVVAALLDTGADGTWAENELTKATLAAPPLLHVEVTNILRKALIAGNISADSAAMAHADLMDLAVQLFPFEPLATRIWELHANVSAYDAWYVALAESLDVPLLTLDLRLARSPGVRCRFRTRVLV